MGYVIENACCCGGQPPGSCCGCPMNQLETCTDKGPFMNDVLNITVEAQCGTSTGQLTFVSNGGIPGPIQWTGTVLLDCWHMDGQGNIICVAASAVISLICSGSNNQWTLTISCTGTPDDPYVVDPPGVITIQCNPFLFHMTNARPHDFDCCYGNVDNPAYNEHVTITITN